MATYLFESIPGCFTERDAISFFDTEQVDIGVGNDRLANGPSVLPPVILVECKDWAKPVDSKTVGYFINILTNRSVEAGILIAANGITGDPNELTNAHALGVSAMARGIKILIVTTAEITDLTCTADLTNLLKRRYLRAIMRGGMGVPEYEQNSDDTDRLFLAWDERRREAGARLDRALSEGRTLLTGSHDQQCEGLRALARLVGASGERPPKTEQSATDCRWTWSTAKRAERRVWEVKTSKPNPLIRNDVNQLLGQIEVESRRSARTRVYGCLLTPAVTAKDDAAEAAHDKIVLINHGAAVLLYDLLADRLRQYDALCGDGNTQARGEARTKIEALLPQDGWLGKLLSPTRGKLIAADDVAAIFPSI